MTDYLWSFPVADLARALEGLAVLRTELSLPPGAQPGNALGDPRDASGEIIPVPTGPVEIGAPTTAAAAWIGRQGSAASTVKDMAGEDILVPARGDPSRYYMHIRTMQALPEGATFDPGAYGLEPTDPAESAAVLGVWAGDVVPVESHRSSEPKAH